MIALFTCISYSPNTCCLLLFKILGKLVHSVLFTMKNFTEKFKQTKGITIIHSPDKTFKENKSNAFTKLEYSNCTKRYRWKRKTGKASPSFSLFP